MSSYAFTILSAVLSNNIISFASSLAVNSRSHRLLDVDMNIDCVYYSLGITILELVSDLDLPKGGDLWHELRSGKLPDEFLVGK